MVVATRRRAEGRRQKTEGKEPATDDRSDPRRVPGACVKTPGGLRAYVLGADPQNPGKILIEYESRGLGEDSYQASRLTLVHRSPDAAAQAQSCDAFEPGAQAIASTPPPSRRHPSSLTPHPPDPLSHLATQINTLHRQGDEAEATAIAAGKAALHLRKEEGDRLLEAKAQLKHGQWSKWLKANCPDSSERSCQVYMQLAEGWEHVEKNAAAAALTLREAIALLPKKAKATETVVPAPTASPLDYTPLPEPKPCWFKVGDSWTEGQAIAQNQRGMVRLVWGENRESDIDAERVQSLPPATAIASETEAALAAAGLVVCKPSITPTEFNREMWGDLVPDATAIFPTPEPETPIVRLKVKRCKGGGVEILSAIVQINGITHYLQLEDLTLEG